MAKRKNKGQRPGEEDRREREAKDANRDPITGTPGSHPVGTGLGAAGGGVAGAAIGAVGGPIGAAVGAAVGAVAGGLAGKGIAEQVDPTVEDRYWRENYRNRPYYQEGSEYEEYQPAYRYGWESYSKHRGRRFEDVESDLSRDWDKNRGKSRLGWEKARHALRDEWDRLTHHEREHGDVDVRGEEDYWRSHYATRSYYRTGSRYEDYHPSYAFGWASYSRHRGRRFEDVESDLRSEWEKQHGESTWDKVKDTVRDAWDRLAGRHEHGRAEHHTVDPNIGSGSSFDAARHDAARQTDEERQADARRHEEEQRRQQEADLKRKNQPMGGEG